MTTININRTQLQIPVAIERALHTLKTSGYVAKKSQFIEGHTRRSSWQSRHRYETYVLSGLDNQALRSLGIQVKVKPDWLLGLSRREVRFFEDHPRCDYVVSGNAKRINLILRKLEDN
jgi:soluble lytic murein transglycosylase-like protein